MSIINSVLNGLFRILLSPFEKLGPWPGIILVSLLATVLALLIFKFTTNQQRLKKRKKRVLAHVLELLIFRDDFVLNIKALKDVFLFNLLLVEMIWASHQERVELRNRRLNPHVPKGAMDTASSEAEMDETRTI